MKEMGRDESGASPVQHGNLVAILTIMTAMVRRVNRNIAKVELELTHEALPLVANVTQNRRSET